MTEQQLLDKVGDAYLPLIHLGEGLDDATAAIIATASDASDNLIWDLIAAGDSWRERLIGLVLACHRGIATFGDAMLTSLGNPRGISIVPTCAALVVAVRQEGYEYHQDQTAGLDRSSFDGEVGYALVNLHAFLGLCGQRGGGAGPNYGQLFTAHVSFYERLCGV